MRIISFYTDDEYKECILKLCASAKKFGHNILYAFFPEATSWETAIQRKTTFIFEQYDRYGGPLLYLDADCLIQKHLGQLEKFILEHDLSVRRREQYNAGVMGFGKNREVLVPFLQLWYRRTLTKGLKYQTIDQKPLEYCIDASGIDVGELDIKYNMMGSDVPEGHNIEDAVIHHYKFSKTGEKARSWKKRYLGL